MPRSYSSRSRSPHRTGHPHKRSRHHSPSYHRQDLTSQADPRPSRPLPLSAQPISKHDLTRLRPLFALYLDIQKGRDMEDLEENEVKGRWKSFVWKWNNGDLAEGWYDPKTLERALSTARETSSDSKSTRPKDHRGNGHEEHHDEEEAEEADDDFGPALPDQELQKYDGRSNVIRSGAALPSIDELRARQEDESEAARLARHQHYAELRNERQNDRILQKSRLEDLAPRADPGTHARALENRQALNASNKSFGTSLHESGDVDLKDSDIMGEDGLSEFKEMRQNEERKKSEREERREEVMRVKRMERQEKLRVLREKEERTMAGLRMLVRERFG